MHKEENVNEEQSHRTGLENLRHGSKPHIADVEKQKRRSKPVQKDKRLKKPREFDREEKLEKNIPSNGTGKFDER